MVVRLVLLVALVALSACAAVDSSSGPTSAAPDAGATVPSDAGALQPSEAFTVSEVALTDGGRRVAMPVLVADDPATRATGLMHRRSLPADAGMLFIFDEPSAGAFWMMDVTIPLSIAFVGQDGTVQQIMDMQPCAAEPCARYQPDDEYLYAIEANQGYFASRGITPGWTLEMDDVAGAL